MFYSLQGEGPRTGVPSIFLRLFGCNLRCGYVRNPLTRVLERDERYWECDSTKSWLYKEDTLRKINKKDLHTLVNRMYELNSSVDLRDIDLVVTGGEPLIHVDDDFLEGFGKLIVHYDDYTTTRKNNFSNVYFETNGTISPSVFKHLLPCVKFNCSPKTDSSGNDKKKRLYPDILNEISRVPGSSFKFVVKTYEDINEILEILMLSDIGDPELIWLMPEGQTREEIEKHLPLCAEMAKEYGWRVSNRMQIQIWNKTTGV